MDGYNLLFFLKKLISAWLLPLPIAMALFAISLLFLWQIPANGLLKSLLTVTFLILLICSNTLVAQWLINTLEQQYPPLFNLPPGTHLIVVLGGGNSPDKNEPPLTRLSGASLARMEEGVRLARQDTKTHILFSAGSGHRKTTPNAVVMAEGATEIGFPKERIEVETRSWDTRGNADLSKPLINGRPFVLVTSANHMPRAMGLFEKRGMHPTAAPTGFIGNGKRSYASLNWVPSSGALGISAAAIHEWTGILYAKLRGYI